MSFPLALAMALALAIAIALTAVAATAGMPVTAAHGPGSPATLIGMSARSAHLPSVDGYWQVGSDGGIFAFGGAQFYGSTGALVLNQPVVGMASTPDGLGYWMVAADGGVFSYGDAHFYGSTGAIHLNRPVVAMASTPDGKGYWMVASDGGIFAFGDATFYGSAGAAKPSEPVERRASGSSPGCGADHIERLGVLDLLTAATAEPGPRPRSAQSPSSVPFCPPVDGSHDSRIAGQLLL